MEKLGCNILLITNSYAKQIVLAIGVIRPDRMTIGRETTSTQIAE